MTSSHAVHYVGLSLLIALVACGSEATEPTPTLGGEAAPPGGDPPASGEQTTPPSTTPPGDPCATKEKLAGDLDWQIEAGGQKRTVYVHVPQTYDPKKPTPVVLNFHGYTSNAKEQATYTGMIRKADESGFVAVHAEGIGKSWNAGACCGDAMDTKVDDVGFVNRLIDELQSKLCVDDKRVFSTGMSNGGFLSHRLACELSTRIAAIAPVAGVVGIPTCTPPRAVPVMHFHGTADALVPYKGSASMGTPSVQETVDGWATRNGCTDKPRETFKAGDVKCVTQDACAAKAEVTLCTIQNGGHTWPGAVPFAIMGHTSQDIRATDAMWEFFQKHPMP